MNEKRQAIRSKAIRQAARGERCTMEIIGVCNSNPATVVLAHLHDETFGKGRKADDTSAVFACSACHAYMDARPSKIDAELLWYKLRGLQRTIRRLVERGILGLRTDDDPKRGALGRKKTRDRPPPLPCRLCGKDRVPTCSAGKYLKRGIGRRTLIERCPNLPKEAPK